MDETKFPNLYHFNVDYLTFSHKISSFCLTEPGKSGTPGKLVTFPDHEDSKYCLPSLIKHYLERTRDRRSGKYSRFFRNTVNLIIQFYHVQ